MAKSNSAGKSVVGKAKVVGKKAAPPDGNGSNTAAKTISFTEALELSKKAKGFRHLLLGNGFSISLFPKIFSYQTLFESAKNSPGFSKELKGVFELLGTTDFEKVVEALENSAALVSIYEKTNPKLAEAFRAEAGRLRTILAETIAKNHPARPYDISDAQFASCRRFLANFSGNIYTLNYDLLLYWTLMKSNIAPNVKSDDGFRNPDGREEDFVTWDVQNTNRQRIHYLHGALHIYDAGPELLKFTWSKTNIALVDQIKQSLDKRKYPLIVTEGTSDQKKSRIQHSNFLGRGYRSFASIDGSLFIYGHSLAPNDEHLLKLIDKGKLQMVFVGIYGDINSPANQKIVGRAMRISARRSAGRPAEVHFFDAETAQVWNGPPPEEQRRPGKPRPR